MNLSNFENYKKSNFENYATEASRSVANATAACYCRTMISCVTMHGSLR